VDPPGVQFDEHQHIEPLQPYCVDGEEVAGHDASGLLAQERRPALACTPRRWVEPVAAKRCSDRGGRDPHAKPDELAVGLGQLDLVVIGQQWGLRSCVIAASG
jgi:hypothetical protein